MATSDPTRPERGPPAKRPHSLSPAEELLVVEAFGGGVSQPRLARIWGVHERTVYNILRRQGVGPRALRLCHVNETAFDNAASDPLAAFFVGLLMTDGCVRESGVISLSLAGADGQLVSELRGFLKSEHKLSMRPPSARTPQPQTRLSISSRRLCNALAVYGVGPRKSLTAEVAGGLEMNRHFWLGAVCGDGWVLISKKGYPYLGFCGSLRMVEQFAAFCRALTPTAHRPARNGRGNCWRFDLACRHAVRVIRHLFADCPAALARKRAVADQILRLA